MNVRQMVCHLNDAFLCIMGEKQVSMDQNFKARLLMKWGALYLPLRWPPDFATRPELDQERGGTTPGEFDEDRQRLSDLVEKFAHRPRDFSFRPHPMFQQMSEWQWMRWGYLHTDHHLRQFGA